MANDSWHSRFPDNPLRVHDLVDDPEAFWDAGDLVRKDMMLHFGAFITESSGHLSEYVPYYRTRPEIQATYCGAEYDGESFFYATNWPQWRPPRTSNG